MFLVEYIYEKANKKTYECIGYYSKDEALNFALKLNTCSYVSGVTVSEIDTSFADIIYQNDKKLDSNIERIGK